MGRGKKSVLIVPEDRLRAIPMVNIEIDHGNPFRPMIGPGVECSDRGGIENAKPHSPLGLCVVTRRACQQKSIIRRASHDRVNRRTRPAGRFQGCR